MASSPWHGPRVLRRLSILVCVAVAVALTWRAQAQSRESSVGGDALYDRYCAACHGVDGGGFGPATALVWPPPRDFRRGDYKWRTTPSGSPPTDSDLMRTIRYGVTGTSMHAFDGILSADQIGELIAKLKSFSPRKFQRQTEAVVLEAAPSIDLARGRQLYTEMGCVQCHGAEGHGDGPSAKGLVDDAGRSARPYDLGTTLIRRPMAASDNPVEQIALSLATGLSGTPMPSYQGAVPDADLWQVAAFVDSIRAKEAGDIGSRRDSIPKRAQRYDRDKHIMRGGYYPGRGSEAESALFGGEIMPQGAAPEALAPAQANLDAHRCARCHNQQYRDWQSSVHAAAGSPGLIAQLLAMERNQQYGSLQSCQRCHGPLAEQSPVLSSQQSKQAAAFAKNPQYSAELREQGLTCASCHVRQWKRSGPPKTAGGKRLSLQNYPYEELAIYERSDFCMPCHQLPSRSSLGGRPLLNTYKEWLEGPYMRRGVQCQHCHMPDREHSWKGVHDPETFRQGIEVDAIAARGSSGVVSVRAKLKNVGAGHYLPTTPTPAAFFRVQLIDAQGKYIAGAATERRIGRHLVYDKGWKELEDTRIPPGESFEIAQGWKAGRVDEATHVLIEVRVEPDEYYERFYERQLRGSPTTEERKLFIEALRQTRRSPYVALRQRVPIAAP